jgi:hypothetical protein
MIFIRKFGINFVMNLRSYRHPHIRPNSNEYAVVARSDDMAARRHQRRNEISPDRRVARARRGNAPLGVDSKMLLGGRTEVGTIVA